MATTISRSCGINLIIQISSKTRRMIHQNLMDPRSDVGNAENGEITLLRNVRQVVRVTILLSLKRLIC
jgi:hypothetical protein